ncbi:hypothetical protein EJB05_44440 [Eragrostis curvula]|uniref:Pectin acetylesterase n=1 Tax=Eragrostis curvula TaxID=38414 RepID=A0A5J9THJ8_9POAL|nr:hypothetical protein EJB05_44440 [Eragrostis curvula]
MELRQRLRQIRTLAVAAALVLLSPVGPLRCRSHDIDVVELTLLVGAQDKGAVCLDGSPAGYHLQTGSDTGSQNWIIHLQGGGWCSTVKGCSDRKMNEFGSSNFMKPQSFSGILSNDQQINPGNTNAGTICHPVYIVVQGFLDNSVFPLFHLSRFYNWNRVYVRYCDGASFAGDSQLEDQSGSKLFFRGERIWEAVIDELMEKGLAESKQVVVLQIKELCHVVLYVCLPAFQALLTGCSAGGLATLLHCDNFRARFPPNILVKCLPDAGFFLDKGLIRAKVHVVCIQWSCPPSECHESFTQGLSHIQGSNRELMKSIKTPTFVLNSAYDSWQIRNVVAPDGSYSDSSWLSCKADIRNCNPAQIQVLHGFRNTMVDELKSVEENMGWGWFIDSCFTHCQTVYDISWNSPVSPRLGNKTVSEAVGDWYFGNQQEVEEREVDCEFPCNPTCSSRLPNTAAA